MRAAAQSETDDGPGLVEHLVAVARTLPPSRDAEPEVVADHDGTVVVLVGGVVVKAHRVDAPPHVVARRATIAAQVPALLSPVALPGADLPPYVVTLAGRAVTAWPRGRVVDRTDPDAAPWAETGAVVARLHQQSPSVAGGLTAHGPDRVGRAVAALRRRGHPAAAPVLAAADTLAPWTTGAAPWPRTGGLVHGDVHLGQLVVPPGGNGDLVLLDVDDVGLGAPVWDLARPAAWYLTGMVDDAVWSTFLTGYHDAGGPVLAGGRDPWPELEPAARALTVQMAARTLVKGAEGTLDTPAQWLVEACRRIVAVGSIPTPP